MSMWKKPTDEIFYLWNWILCRCWRLISAEIRQSSTFSHSVQPDAFINLSFVGVVELSISVLFATPPGAVKPVSIYLKKSVKFSNSTVSLGQSFLELGVFFRLKTATSSYCSGWCPALLSCRLPTLLRRYLHTRNTSFPSHCAGSCSSRPRTLHSCCRSTSHTPEEITKSNVENYFRAPTCVCVGMLLTEYRTHTCFFPSFHWPQYFLTYSFVCGRSTV